MSHIARNRGLILKTFLYQVVMSFFGVMMYLATYRNAALFVIGQTAVILFSFYIFFSQSMQAGSKECEYGFAHKEEKSSPWFGLLPVFLGFLPMIVLSLWNVFLPPYQASGEPGSIFAFGPFELNKVLQQGVFEGIYQVLFPTVSGDSGVAAENAAALNAQARVFPFAFLPGWIAGSAGFAFGWFRFRGSGKNAKAASDDKTDEKEDEKE